MSFDDGWEDREREESELLADARDEVRRETLASLDLNDPEVENFVADAIVRLAPEGAYVKLSTRYPWRFSEPTAGRQSTDLLQPLLRLAALLDDGSLVPGPPPGRCGAENPYGPPQLSCDLRAGHTGQHETPWREGRAYWEQIT